MAIDFSFRRKGVGKLTTSPGVYILADLNNVPVYVGQSTSSIRGRVQRHLTSARSDVIANRQIDVWEIAFVWAYPVKTSAKIGPLEAVLFHHYHPKSRLMNGTVPAKPLRRSKIPDPADVVQVMSDEEIAEKKGPELRLPRQAAHYAQLVSHFVSVKNSDQVATSMDAHFERLAKYHSAMLGLSTPEKK